MAGAFSGHLIQSSNQLQTHPPFTSQPSTDNISIHSAMSFNPQMHGTFQSQPSFSECSQSRFGFIPLPMSMPVEMSDATTLKIAALQAKLNQKLGPEYISQRPGPGGGPKLTYAEGWKIINLANEVFGFNGWSSSVVNLTTDFVDFNEESRRYTVGTTAVIRVTLRDGVFHEDVGYGMLENSKSKGAALDKCKKEAVTDGLKRALRNFGNLLGNCLYDKSYTQEVVKIKVPPPKFDKGELHRRPEFDETKPDVNSSAVPTTPASSTSNANPQHKASSSSSSSSKLPAHHQPNTHTNPNLGPNSNATPNAHSTTPRQIKSEHQEPQASTSRTPFPALPPHMRSEVRASTPSNNVKGKNAAVVPYTGLNTPVRTPDQPKTSSANQPRPPPSKGNGQVSAAIVSAPPLPPPPPPPPPQAQPRVTFADPPHQANATATSNDSSECFPGDESFTFNSDDDAFFAGLDLGDGDLGRPIDFEEGAQRPIDDSEAEEGSGASAGGGGAGDKSPTGVCDSGALTEWAHTGGTGGAVIGHRPVSDPAIQNHHYRQQQHTTMGPPTALGPRQPPSSRNSAVHGQGQGQRAESQSIQRNPSATSAPQDLGVPQTRQQQQQPQKQPGFPLTNRSMTSSAATAATVHVQKQASSSMNGQNQNHNPLTSTSAVAASSKRPVTPSMGGFHFPPGMNPFGAQPMPAAVSSNISNGVKRPAEAMMQARRTQQGMGLAQQRVSLKREPLGRLDVGENGDVKRVRR